MVKPHHLLYVWNVGNKELTKCLGEIGSDRNTSKKKKIDKVGKPKYFINMKVKNKELLTMVVIGV